VNNKSNLKKDFEKKDEKGNGADKGRKRSVTFGDATKIEFEGESESGDLGNRDEEVKKDGKWSPRLKEKKVVEVKDLSDGRNEKEKIKEMLEKKEKEQLEQIKKMAEWKPQDTSSTAKPTT
jgi:hypothetical protein